MSTAATIVYVDSGSVDGSAEWARLHGANVIELDAAIPFMAARARNAGFNRLRKMAPDLLYAQFMDGDCELNNLWPEQALSFLESHKNVGVVCGRLRERYPERSIYNWLCDQEWDGPTGEVRACGGPTMMRVDALEAVGGYRDDLIARSRSCAFVCVRQAGTFGGWKPRWAFTMQR